MARNVLSNFSFQGVPAICYYLEEWYLWDGIWKRVSDKAFKATVWETCKEYIKQNWPRDAKNSDGTPKAAPQFGRAATENVLLALTAMVTVNHLGWLDSYKGRWIAFKDKILNLDAWIDGQLEFVDQTPKYFDPNALEYNLDYTEDEPALFLAKLREQFSSNDVQVVQEFGGYCLTPDTSYQHILYMVGPPRSFKGTYERKLLAM